MTDLFPEEANKGKFNYLFFRTQEVLDEYLGLKEQQKLMKEQGTYTGQKRYEIAKGFGKLLSYPDEGIDRLIQKTLDGKKTTEK